jgi:ribonucleotide reductase alpha subunit
LEEKMNEEINVKKRNGGIEPLQLSKLHEMVQCACEGLSGVSVSQVEMASGIQFYDGISTNEIQEILIKSASDLISLEHPNYQYVAARLLLFSIRKKIYGGRIDLPHLSEHIKKCVDLGVYDSAIYDNYTEEELDEANSFIDHDRDLLFTYAAMREAVDKYLVQNRTTKTLYETPQFMYIMIGLVAFAKYPKETRLNYVKRFYDVASKHKINIPTPIMAAVRTKKRQYSSCTLLDCGDSLESIIATNSALMRYVSNKAGIGLNVGRIRGLGKEIRKGDAIHTGLVPFIKSFEGILNSCSQGSIRKGSATLFFPIWHQEIRELIVLKNEKGNDENRARSLDYAVTTSKIFYERFIKNGNITLFSPYDVPGLYEAFGTPEFDDLYVKYENDTSIPKEVVSAQELTLEILGERSDTGRLYLMNIDHVNSHSPYKQTVRMSNLCVAGDTKIKIRYPEPEYEDYGGDIWNWHVFEKEIEIEELEDYIIDRKCNVSHYAAYEGDPCEDVPKIEVLSYNVETNKREWKPITAFAETSPKAQVMKLRLSNNTEIVVTPDHKVYTNNRGYVMARDLTAYDELVSVNSDDGLKIVSTEYLEEEIPVYDITVEGTHNFFANGVLVSNCMEITLLTEPLEHIDDTNGAIALCILSAINVGTLRSLDELQEYCDLIVRFLDELIDIQEYPVKAAEIPTKKNRTLGIGITGLAHYLARNSVNYEDPEAVNLVHKLSESFQYYLLKTSVQLAKEKGACEGFMNTKYADGILPIDTYKKEIDNICSEPLHYDWEELRKEIDTFGLRHTTHSSNMPCESSSKILNTTNGIEPPRGYLSVKRKVRNIVPQYNKLKNNYTLLWDMKSNEGYFNIVAVMQKFFDQSISTNWSYNPQHYSDNKVPMSVIVKDFLSAYSLGHKTAYYLNTYDGKDDDMEVENLVDDILDMEEEDCDACKL